MGPFSNRCPRTVIDVARELPFGGRLGDDVLFRPRAKAPPSAGQPWARQKIRAGVIANARSHRNRKNGLHFDSNANLFYAAPQSLEALDRVLAEYAAEGINLLIVDGGDGTIRDVVTAASDVFPELPNMAVIPSGKTNAVALDLGIPKNWSVQAAVAAAHEHRFAARAPIEISRPGTNDPVIRGFLFGAGGFVRATELAQRTHRMGAFDGVAVAWSLAWSITQTLFGGANNVWRKGEYMHFRTCNGRDVQGSFYLLFMSTLERLPLGLKPFGRPRPGLKALAVQAPPARPLLAFGPILMGMESEWLADAGYHRADPDPFDMTLEGEFVLDGEHFPGGELSIRAGKPLYFAVP